MLVFVAAGADASYADPCGMVPPIYVKGAVPIQRIGLQKTYVFYKNGIETFVIRPGYRGNVDNFGMLIPFPTPPAIRKVSDDIFPHIASAIDPPEVVVDLRWEGRGIGGAFRSRNSAVAEDAAALKFESVRVLRQEAVGMYEVAVLEAGSASALKRWMDDHGYQYPDGMDAVCEEYVDIGWCFVAVKTRIGQKAGVNPKPGLREVDPDLPEGATFDGSVQAMGFRFHTKEFVVPMRLSAFNEGELRNIVYILTDKAKRINNMPRAYVVRQIPGKKLYKNLTRPLPLRVLGGRRRDIPDWRKNTLEAERDPKPHNGLALDLFASDLQAIRRSRLSHEFEESEKELLRIGERLGLRGAELDKYHHEALAKMREKALRNALQDIKRMTLTVVDGDFSREVVARENLTFANHRMWGYKNRPGYYDAKQFGPAPDMGGRLYQSSSLDPDSLPLSPISVAGALLLGFLAVGRRWTRGGMPRARSGMRTFIAIITLAGVLCVSTLSVPAKDRVASLIGQLAGSTEEVADAIESLVARGGGAIEPLVAEAEGGEELTTRGWAIVCLSEIGGDAVDRQLAGIHNDSSQPALVRTWAAAARVNLARDVDELTTLAGLVYELPPLNRPIAKRVLALYATGEPASIEMLIDLSLRIPQLQAPLATPILAGGPEPLVKAMVGAEDTNVRRQATAYLATLGSQGNDGVAAAVVGVYRYTAGVKDVPWRGGPLYVPGLNWQQKEARGLAKNLIKWLVFCERNELQDESRQIHNNLRSITLAQAAGYQLSGGGDSRAWFKAWGQAFGRRSLKAIFDEQRVADKEPFRRILREL
jgi:hypothetical protein